MLGFWFVLLFLGRLQKVTNEYIVIKLKFVLQLEVHFHWKKNKIKDKIRGNRNIFKCLAVEQVYLFLHSDFPPFLCLKFCGFKCWVAVYVQHLLVLLLFFFSEMAQEQRLFLFMLSHSHSCLRFCPRPWLKVIDVFLASVKLCRRGRRGYKSNRYR